MPKSTPTKLRIQIQNSEIIRELKAKLTYTDTSVDFMIGKNRKTLKSMVNNPNFWKEKLGGKYQGRLIWLTSEIKKLEASKQRCLLELVNEEASLFEVPSGLLHVVQSVIPAYKPDLPELPEPKLVPWSEMPPRLRYYQEEAVAALLEASERGIPACISLATGGGKSLIIATLIKKLALKTLVMVPSTSIANQLYDDLERFFGRGKVGMFGGGKKQSNRLITVGIDDSLVRLKPGDEHWDNLSECQVFITDEVHCIASETQEMVASGVASKASRRFGLSATVMRNDGRDLLLEGYAGPIVYRKDLLELVQEGYLAKPEIQVHKLDSGVSGLPEDPNEQTRMHLFYSDAVNRKAAEIANRAVAAKRPVLVAIDEIEQFAHIIPHLNTKLRIGFAHGPLTKENRDTVPEPYRSQNPKEQVDLFNDGKLDILVGTSCVAMGTDTRLPECGIYLVGGKSLIELSQRMGRCTRGGSKGTVENPYTGEKKVSFEWHDFWVTNSPVCTYHAKERSRYYKELGYTYLGQDDPEE